MAGCFVCLSVSFGYKKGMFMHVTAKDDLRNTCVYYYNKNSNSTSITFIPSGG